MTFEIWDAQTGNLLAAHATEADAAQDIRETAARFGVDALAHFAVAVEDDAGHTRAVAEGVSLIRWAESVRPDASTPAAKPRRIA